MNFSNLRIIIVGPRHSGKNTFAAMLHEELDCCQTFDIGSYLIRQLAERGSSIGLDHRSFTANAEYIAANKDSFRAQLIALADELRANDPAALIQKGFRAAPIVVGVRLHSELRKYLSVSCFALRSGLLIELRREGCLLRDGGDNFELTNAHQMYLQNFASVMCIDNNGSIEDLRKWAKLAAKAARGMVA